MPTDRQENTRYSEKGKHLFASFRACIPPPLNTGIHAFCKFIHLCNVDPSNAVRVFSIQQFFVDMFIGLKCCGNRQFGSARLVGM